MTWLAVGAGIGFAGAESLLLNLRIRDFDEGVYLQRKPKPEEVVQLGSDQSDR